MGPLTAVGRCYANTLNFSGRARRAEYWWFALFLFIAGTAIQFGLGVYFARDPAFALALSDPAMAQMWLTRGNDMLYVAAWAYAGYLLFAWLPQLSVTVRRLHDTNRSGWYILMPTLVTILSVFAAILLGPMLGGVEAALPLILMAATAPLLSMIWFLVVLCLPGTQGNNRFGPDPAPERPRNPPAHPAFARTLPDEVKTAVQARNRSEFQEYYRTRVAPAIQQNKTARQSAAPQ
ncbi:hypothetical protein roselon_00694 [Roseibacterium elongatum DSM 19469]|uniref:Integral membrane protein n=1 Tax=Roseicyclus elongatus DSM 19469 TaxID=1294273 RepID=W8RQ03_9RHOB|nr:DUF805 domain-containing protein [Roseibacterium elongatum]AHM03123.1 hypothetical protein roselon_00694 [Roseibacterium elongatum DSM 19469]